MESDPHECSICMTMMVEPIRISCSHLFCLSCLEKLILDGNLKCPMDRKEFKIEKDLKFDETICKENFDLKQDDFKERAEKLLKDRESLSGLAEVAIVYGNKHKLINNDENNRHKWTAFVEVKKSQGKVTEMLNKLRKSTNLTQIIGSKQENSEENGVKSLNAEDVDFSDDDIIKKVVFRLHPTFHPNTVARQEAPFEIKRIGWGTFSVGMQIEFQDYLGMEKLEVDHFLSFSRDRTAANKPIYINLEKVKQYLASKNQTDI